MHRSSIELQNLIEPQKPSFCQTRVTGSTGLNVLSLFDGMSCGQLALQKAGIKVNQYFASEIKPHAIKVTQHNFPNTIQLGSVLDVKASDLPKIDLLIGGSPCKGISRLNKNQEGLEHSESKLFWEYVRLLEEVKPRYFLLENTHGNKEATEIITETLGVKPISINSKLVSAQNRPRYYWTNIPGVKQPTDKGITTTDVFDYSGQLADECRVKWLTSESGKKSVAKGYTRVNPYPKSGCLTANGHKKWNENYLLKDGIYRYLSQTEIEKLQTLPIGYTKILSYDEAYDCIGDGWTVDIIAHILSFAEWHSIACNVLRLGGRFNAAKPLLYEVPTYLAAYPIETLNRKTKRKKAMAELFEFELEENNEPIETTNINSIRFYVSDEQKEFIEKNKQFLFKKMEVDNLSDYILKKIYEDIDNKA